MAESSSEYLCRVRKLADWFVAGQVKDPASADCGRYVFTLQDSPPFLELTTNWTTGMTCISMLMAWQRTGNDEYLTSSKRAGGYLKSLQMLDRRHPQAFGLFSEVTPQSWGWCHPRDALSAAWALLHLYMAIGDKDCLDRVNIFAKSFCSNLMNNNYPAWTAYGVEKRKPYWKLGSFHGGSPLFFFDLYKQTNNKKWLQTGLKICDTWIQRFLKPDGSIRIEVDPQTNKDLTGTGPSPDYLGWQEMHKLNDDFTSLALLRAYRLTKIDRYLEAAQRFLNYVLSVQNQNGSFGKVPVNSAAPVLILELLEMARLTHKQIFQKAARKSVDHFFSLQELKKKDPKWHGGFYCIHGDYIHNSRVALGARTSAYALAALLRLENKHRYAGYSA